MKRILLHAGIHPYKESNEKNYDINKLENELGYNSGNLVFARAVFDHLNIDSVDIDIDRYRFGQKYGDDEFIDYVNNNYDCCVLPAANWLSIYFYKILPNFTYVIRRLKIPVIVIGLGAQIPKNTDINLVKTIKKEASDFLAAINNKNTIVGLRGEKTAEIFEQLGFHNYVVTGCPSGYSGVLPRKVINENDSKVVVNGRIAELNSYLFRDLNCKKNLCYIDQDEFFRLSRNIILETRALYHFIKGGNVFRDLIKNNRAGMFVNYNSWFNFVAQFEFSLGSRFHGNMISLMSGTPALFITHDSRTSELIELFNFPSIKIDDINKYTAEEIVNLIDYSKFESIYPTIAKRLSRFYADNGLNSNVPDKLMMSSQNTQFSQDPFQVKPNVIFKLFSYL